MRRHSVPARLRAFGILLAFGALVFGTTQAVGSSSAPSMPPPGHAIAPAPLASYQQPTGPTLSDTDIHSLAMTQAARAGDTSPSAVSAVDTALASAEQAIDPQAIIPEAANEAVANFRRSAVVLVVLHGNFTLSTARVPKGRSAPTGTVLSLVIDTHTGWIDARSIQMSDPTGISVLGTVRSLK